MNGDSQQLYSQIKQDIVRLETIMEERWKAHNARSNELWFQFKGDFEDIRKDIKAYSILLAEKPCQVHQSRVAGVETAIKVLWGFMAGIILAFVGVAFRIFIV